MRLSPHTRLTAPATMHWSALCRAVRGWSAVLTSRAGLRQRAGQHRDRGRAQSHFGAQSLHRWQTRLAVVTTVAAPRLVQTLGSMYWLGNLVKVPTHDEQMGHFNIGTVVAVLVLR